jgi:hypothetical protein
MIRALVMALVDGAPVHLQADRERAGALSIRQAYAEMMLAGG